MKSVKRTMSILLAMLLLVSMLPLTVWADSQMITQQPKSVTVENGKVARVTLAATGEGLTYKWYFKNAGDADFRYTSTYTTNTYSLKMDASKSGRQVYCVVTDRNGKSETSDVATLYVGNAATITAQPKSVVVANGTVAKVTVGATGDGLTYKWYFKNAGDADFRYTSTYTTNTYSLKMDASKSGRQVYCVVTDKYGNSVTSDVATLSVGNTVKITAQPKSVTVASGATAKVTVTATGDGLTYKWYYKNKGDSKFDLTTSFTGNTYSVSMTSARAGRQIYCVVTDKYGNSVQSDTVTLSMGNTVKITAQPKSVTVASGATAKVTVTATGDGLTYKWYYKNKGDSKFDLTTSFTGNTYSVSMTSARAGRQIYCVVTDKYGNSVQSDTVTLSMGSTVKITAQPKSVAVASGATAKVTVTATGEGLTYKWYFKNPGDSKFSYTSTFTGNTYSVKMDSTRNGRQIYCVVTDKYGNSVQSDTVTLSIAEPVKIVDHPASTHVANGVTAEVTVTAVGEGLTYKWYYKNRGDSKFYLTTSFTGNTYSVSMNSTRAGRQVYCVVTDKYGNSATSDVATLGMGDPLLCFSQPGMINGAPGYRVSFNYPIDDGTAPIRYQWQVNEGTHWRNITEKDAAWAEDYDTGVLTVQVTEKNIDYRYRCVAIDATGRAATSNMAGVVENFVLVAEPDDVFSEAGNTVTYSTEVMGGTKPYTYQWQFLMTWDVDPGTEWTAISEDHSHWASGYDSPDLKVFVSEEHLATKMLFRCVVTDAEGNQVTTREARLDGPLDIFVQPENVAANPGDVVVFAAVGMGGTGDLTYHWQYCYGNAWYGIGAGDSAWSAGYNEPFLYILVTDDEFEEGYRYRCIISDSTGYTLLSNEVWVEQP